MIRGGNKTSIKNLSNLNKSFSADSLLEGIDLLLTYTLLIIEDDLFTSRLIKTFFEAKGFIVYQAYDIGPALMYATDKSLDLIILDIQLPTNSGFSIFKSLKNIQPCPIVFYSSISSEDIEVKVMEMGGDDYINKQRGMRVLYSRIIRLLNNNSNNSNIISMIESSPILKVNNISLNFELNFFKIGDRLIELRKRECKLLRYLILNKNTMVNRDELSFILHGYSHDGWSRSIDLTVCRLRKKLSKGSIPASAIKTFRGKGYSLIESEFKAV